VISVPESGTESLDVVRAPSNRLACLSCRQWRNTARLPVCIRLRPQSRDAIQVALQRNQECFTSLRTKDTTDTTLQKNYSLTTF